MAARGTFALANPTNVEMTLTVTMSAREWIVIKSHLHPSTSIGEWTLDDSIHQMIEKANQEFHFYEQVEKTE